MGYSGGRGGAGNIKRPANDGQVHTSDRRESVNEESVIRAPAEGEGYSTGRGGIANVHPQGKVEKKHKTNAVAKDKEKKDDGHVAKLGLAYPTRLFLGKGLMIRDKLKYKFFRSKKPNVGGD